jgi:DNA-binding transcriptional LysR family regulator
MTASTRQNPGVFDWNDLRYFLAVARAGSTLGAAAALNLSQTTAARRVAALEQGLGAALFERHPSGYRLTEAGQEILAAAERVEQEALTLERLMQQRVRRLAGTIRVATNEPLANLLLIPALGEFGRLHPEIRIEVFVDDRQADLARGEADVALRGGFSPGEGGLVARRLRDLPWSVYCSSDYAQRKGAPRCAEDLATHCVVGGAGAVAAMPGPRWLEQQTSEPVVTRSSSLTNLMAAVKSGLGLGALPCLLADPERDLVVCFQLPKEFTAGLWLVTRAELRDEPCVKTFNDFIAARTQALRQLFTPRAA